MLVAETMPGATWFPGAQVNYAQHVFSHAERSDAAGHPAIVFRDEAMQAHGETLEITWAELRRQVASFAAALARMGVVPGDRVCAVLPNLPQTAIAFLACASLGAVWSVCSADMGPLAILDRFRQIEPKVVIGVDGYVYGGVAADRLPVLRGLVEELPSVRHAVLLRHLDADADVGSLAGPSRAAHDFDALVADDPPFAPAWLPFDHPLWIVYSSGTTGLPKAIIHGHGGVMLEGLKIGLHNNLGAERRDRRPLPLVRVDRLDHVELPDPRPARRDDDLPVRRQPGGPAGAADWSTLWRFAAETGVTFFGAGAAFYASCLKAGVEPMRHGDLSRLRGIGATGSPLAIECYRWVWDHLPKVEGENIWLTPMSGGTDFAGAFIAGLPTLPVVEGEMQCRCLGASVEAWSEADAEGRGHALIDAVGELVCTRPMPSMPLGFWGDADGSRYRDSYFDVYPGVWRHGDWIRITPRGGAIIYGRSDATINRHGIRMGTAELYRAVEALPEVLDSLVVDLEYLGRESYMPLFVVLREGLRARRGVDQAHQGRHPQRALGAARAERDLPGAKRFRARSPARRWSCRSRSCCSVRRPSRCSSRARWPRPRASTGSPSSPRRRAAT